MRVGVPPGCGPGSGDLERRETMARVTKRILIHLLIERAQERSLEQTLENLKKLCEAD